MATREMNADKENPSGRKMEEEEEGVEPAQKDKDRFSEALCDGVEGGDSKTQNRFTAALVYI